MKNPPKDVKGREIQPGDTLKIFHFTGARRKKYYMYKYVEAIEKKEGWGESMLRISHLEQNTDPYYMAMDGKRHGDIEIVQGYDKNGASFEDRREETPSEPIEPGKINRYLTTLTNKEIRDLALLAGYQVSEETDNDKDETYELYTGEGGTRDDDGIIQYHDHIAFYSDHKDEGCMPLGDNENGVTKCVTTQQ